jgi:hypothetical protein
MWVVRWVSTCGTYPLGTFVSSTTRFNTNNTTVLVTKLFHLAVENEEERRERPFWCRLGVEDQRGERWLRHPKHLHVAKSLSSTAISAREPQARTRWRKHMQVQLSWRGMKQGSHMVEVADPLSKSQSCRADAGRLSLQIRRVKHWSDHDDLLRTFYMCATNGLKPKSSGAVLQVSAAHFQDRKRDLWDSVNAID